MLFSSLGDYLQKNYIKTTEVNLLVEKRQLEIYKQCTDLASLNTGHL